MVITSAAAGVRRLAQMATTERIAFDGGHHQHGTRRRSVRVRCGTPEAWAPQGDRDVSLRREAAERETS